MKDILYYQGLSYILKIICSKIISCYDNNLLASYFGIEKAKNLVNRKYF